MNALLYGGLLLTGLAIAGSLWSKWRAGQTALNDQAVQKEEAKIDALKESIKKTQEDLDASAKNYSSVYDAYKRKYTSSSDLPSDSKPK